MSLISENIIENFSLWAKENKSFFSDVSTEKASYYNNRYMKREYMMEYAFQNIAEMRDVLEIYGELGKNSQMVNSIVVAVSQGKFFDSLELRRCEKEEKEYDQRKNANESNKNEQKKLYNTAFKDIAFWEKREKSTFLKCSEEISSYYISRILEETYMMEYGFKNVETLKNALEMYGGLQAETHVSDELIVEVCQNRYKNQLRIDAKEEHYQQKKDMYDNGRTLPEHIYAF